MLTSRITEGENRYFKTT